MQKYFSIIVIFTVQVQLLYAQDFPSSFPWISDTVYISASASDGGNGSQASPFNNWDSFTFNSKTAYLFKRGGTMDVPGKLVVSADSIFFGGYGKGNRPLFYGMGINKHFVFSGTEQYIQGVNVRCQDTGTCFTFLGDSSKFLWADSINMSHAYWGTNPGGYGKIILSNLYVHRTRVDGIYSSHNDTIIIKNTRVHDVNRWYEKIKDINSSGGDCIQGESNGYVVIDGCTLDHSDMAGKFALIQNGADTVIVKNSTLIGYKESSTVYLGGIEKGWYFDACKIVGGKIGLWNHGTLVIKNCLFTGNRSNAINGSGTTIINSTFANTCNKALNSDYTDATTSVLNGWSESGWKVYNCIFYNVDKAFGAVEDYVTASNNNFYNDSTFDEQPKTQWGENITNYNPLFNPDNGDYEFYILPESELIDAGLSPSTVNQVVPTDINGNARPNGNGYDIGAYEYYKDDVPSGNPSEAVLLFPNPSTGYINIETNADVQWVKIYDMSGRLVFENNTYYVGEEMDISNLNSAVYIVTIKTSSKTVAKKLIKVY